MPEWYATQKKYIIFQENIFKPIIGELCICFCSYICLRKPIPTTMYSSINTGNSLLQKQIYLCRGSCQKYKTETILQICSCFCSHLKIPFICLFICFLQATISGILINYFSTCTRLNLKASGMLFKRHNVIMLMKEGMRLVSGLLYQLFD